MNGIPSASQDVLTSEAELRARLYEPRRKGRLLHFLGWVRDVGPVLLPVVGIGIAVWLISDAGGLPAVSKAITRHRLSGTWHVERSFADWKFGRDGTWTEDALIDTHGSYTLLDDDRIHIKGLLGATMEFKYTFDDEGLLLKGNSGTPFSFRLTRKD
jgi:hypothetical protein